MKSNEFAPNGDIRFNSESLARTPEKPLRGAFLAGGFVFAPGAFVREVPYDPHMYFDHEEITLAARAYTHGWDVFSPTGTYVYHYYNTAGNPNKRPHHWADNKDWGKMQLSSRARYNFLLAGLQPSDPAALAELERYGLGNVRTLAEYEAFSGLDFKAKKASERATKAQYVEHLDHYRTPPHTGWRPEPVVITQETLFPLTPLEAGDFMPPFRLKDDTGAYREIQIFAGMPCIVSILPSAYEIYLREYVAAYLGNTEKLQQLGVRTLFIAPVPAAEVAAYRARNQIPQGVLADENLALCRALGVSDVVEHTPLSFGLDCNQRITTLYNNRNAKNHIADVMRLAQQLSEMTNKEPLKLPAPAPVLVVPDVFTPENLKRLIHHWQNGKQHPGLAAANDGRQVHNPQARRSVDVDVLDTDFLARLDVLLAKRLFPELRKVYDLDVTNCARYKISLYDSADKGFHALHRDTGLPQQVQRRISVSIPLNDDYEGGWLLLPEYGPFACFRAPAGSALCFPSPLLNAVTPVTQGRQFALTTFLHGGEEANIMCKKTYDGLLYSENLYTQETK
jgi:peroxiredoxin/predicted 2-oxoglutarate/Fe(II)-dependent dioxygenase YbiX